VSEKEAAPKEGTATNVSVAYRDKADDISSRQVSWWSVHEFVSSRLTEVGSWPMLGTPAWCDLDDDDERKTAALLDAAQHWALRLETGQQAMADAGAEIVDVKSLVQFIFNRDRCYIPRVAL
jgi:hypothetical protein